MEDKFLAVELLSQFYFEEHCLCPPERQPQETSSPAVLEQSPPGLAEVCFHLGKKKMEKTKFSLFLQSFSRSSF